MSLGIDETDRLIVTVKPEEAKPVLIWNSSDENIVKVTDGVVMGCNAGTAVVKVSVKDQNELFATCEYTVLDPDVDMQTLDIIGEPIVLRPGGHQQLTVNFTPENQNEMILWSSTNESIARVSPRGKVEAIKVGVAKIIAISDRTGVADTAIVSVEGTGVIGNAAIVQTDNPQNSPTSAQKPAPAQNPAPSQKPVITQKPSPAPASKPAQTSAPKNTVKTTPKPAASTASKPATVKTTKPAQSAATKSSGSKDFGYATFKGTWPDDVKGRMEFKSTHVIDSRDPKRRMASPGDYVVGEWSEGHLVQGIWYGSDNKAKGSILIGK
ncbi:MAG: Ig-like domain-containing protein [Prevotella sp.]|nr:Ig-like domain-containing protein [Prevotella sp.]